MFKTLMMYVCTTNDVCLRPSNEPYLTQIKDSRHSFRRRNRKLTHNRTGIRPDPQSDLTTNGANDTDEFTRGRDTRLF